MDENLLNLIKRHEGFREFPYRCTAGKLTIGFGHNLDDRGISKKIAEQILKEDIGIAVRDCYEVFQDFHLFSQGRQHAFVDMMLNLGINRFKGFKKMIRAANNRDWDEVERQMVDSKWYGQVGQRSEDLRKLIREG